MQNQWDKQFKERLGNYSQSPKRDLWPDIEYRLARKKENRPLILPLWWKTGGVISAAASLALMLWLIPSAKNGDSTIQLADNSSTKIDPYAQTGSLTPDFQGVSDEPVAVETIQTAKQSKAFPRTEMFQEPNQHSTSKAISIRTSKVQIKASTKRAEPVLEQDAVTLAGETYLDKSNDINTLAPSNEVNPIAEQSSVAYAGAIDVPKIIDDNEVRAKGKEADIATNLAENQIKGKAEDPSATMNRSVTSLDSAEDVEQELTQDEGPTRSWSVLPVAGPVYHNSLGQGSVFDPSFSDNIRQGDLTFSYGLRLNLKLDKRLQLRTGINSVAMGYTTKDIEIATGPAAYGLNTVTYDNNRNVISVFDKGTLPSNPNPDPTNPYNQLSLKSSGGDLSLRANINYLEFPLELSYALIDQKVRLSVISGISGLLLSNNEVSVNDGENRYVLGSLNNLNDFSFSTNIGFGVNYALFEGFNLQLEPTFKYQLGTYNDASVDFSPYQLVLLSGFQFQF